MHVIKSDIKFDVTIPVGLQLSSGDVLGAFSVRWRLLPPPHLTPAQRPRPLLDAGGKVYNGCYAIRLAAT
eukprot:2138563-Amphidinium_carterae.1